MAVLETTPPESAMPSADAVWKQMQERGTEFVFAQFVDMYARPSAKLVPVRSRDDFDGILTEGAGFAGFAAGEIGQLPSDPDIAAIPDLSSYTPVPLQQNLARFACDATVQCAERPHAPVRLPDDGLALLQRARVGQLRQRPRGRERAVRAELHVHERARELRPRDLLPLHGARPRRTERDDRDLHAEAVLAPDRQRLSLPHVALGRGHEPLPRRSRPARARALRDGVPLHRRPEETRSGDERLDRADRQLVQAPEGRYDDERRHVVARVDLVRL